MASLAKPVPLTVLSRVQGADRTSPLRYQVAQRMRRAREFLDFTDAPAAQIADQLGYEDQFYFSCQFTQEHGISPRAYRQRTKG